MAQHKLLLLHGAIGSSKQLNELKILLSADFEVYTLNFSGHGGNAITEVPFSIALFANDVLNFLDENKIERTNIFGYSMGGYVALYLAKHYPDKVIKIITLATKFDWNEEGAFKESQLLNPETIEFKLPAFAEELKIRHAPQDWKMVLGKTAGMMLEMGKNNVLLNSDFEAIDHRVMLTIGDKDKMVTTDETIATHQKIRNSSFLILPDTAHPIERINMDLLAKLIRDFILQ